MGEHISNFLLNLYLLFPFMHNYLVCVPIYSTYCHFLTFHVETACGAILFGCCMHVYCKSGLFDALRLHNRICILWFLVVVYTFVLALLKFLLSLYFL